MGSDMTRVERIRAITLGLGRGVSSPAQQVVLDGHNAGRQDYQGDIPAPLAGDLFPVQEEGIRIAIPRLQAGAGFIFADEMGMGKTIQALQLASHFRCANVLVLCPASVRDQWRAEARRWLPSYSNPTPSALVRVESHHALTGSRLDGKWMDFDMVILDELHLVSAAQAQALWKLKARLRVGLSGTLAEKPGQSHRAMAWVYDSPEGWVRYSIMQHAKGHLAVLAPAGLLVARKKSMLKLPQSEFIIHLLSGRSLRLGKDYLALSSLRTGSEERVPWENMPHARREVAKAKVAWFLKEIYPSPGVAFYHHRAIGDMLEQASGWPRLSGGMTSRQKAIAINQAEAEGKGLIVSLRAGGTGLNLQFLQHATFVEMDWSARQMLQAMSRIIRPGMSQGAAIHIPVGEGIDLRIAQLLAEKNRFTC